jgi:isochorismate hydrolase
MNAYFKK